MEEQHQYEVEANSDEIEELENLEEDVKLMAEKIAELRQTLPEELKDTLASIISTHRPPNFTSPDPGPSNLDVTTHFDSEDPVHAEKVQTIKHKVTNNASAMPLLVKRMEVCISRMDKLDSFKQEMIHPAFTRKR